MRRGIALISLVLMLSAACVNANIPYPTPRPTRTPTVVTVALTEAVTPAATISIVSTEAVDMPPGDPAEGDRLFHTFQPAAGIQCSTCHRTDSDDRLVGPGLKSVGIRAQTRVPGQSAWEYLHTSIVDPSAYVVADYPNLMPKNWGKVFTEAQIDDLIAYLFSLSQS